MKVKILFFSHSAELYGAEKVLLQIIEGLNKKGIQPILVLPRTGPFHEEAKKLSVKTVLIPSKWWLTERNRVWKQPLSWLWNIKSVARIARLIRQESIDLVYSNSAVNFCGGMAAKWKKVPHIWCLHEILGTKKAPVRFLLGKRALISLLLALSAKIIVNSETTGQPFMGKDKVHIVPIGFKWNLEQGGLKEIYRQKFGFKPTDYVIGIVGKIYPEKGQKKVVESIGIVKKIIPEVKLLVIGEVKDKKYFKKIQKFISAQKLEKHVVFEKYQADILSVLAHLDLLVVASCVESFGRVAVEAMSVKTPVLAVRKGATAEIITAGENGFLVDYPVPGMLADAILSIRENPEQARNVAEKGHQSVCEKYSIENQLEKTEEIIRKCLSMNYSG